MQSALPQPEGLRLDLVRAAALDQAGRMLPGASVLPALLVVLWIATPYPSDHPGAYATFWLAAAASAALRVMLARRAESLYAARPGRLNATTYGAAILSSCANGLLHAHALGAYGFESWTFTITLLWNMGTASGSTISFTPTLKLLRVFVLLMFVPAAIIGVLHGRREGYTYALASVLVQVFLLAQGKGLNAAYRMALETSGREAARNREVELARQKAESANAAKSVFLANMSHEIRTPMHGILGMTEIAMTSKDPLEIQEALQTVQSSGEALLEVLNDILDFSKIEAGKMTFETLPLSMEALVKEVRDLIDGRIRSKGLSSEWRVAPGVPPRVIGDPTRLKQVLINLLGNAIKFCEVGSVTLLIDLDPSGLLLFSVSDTGIGIPKDHQPAIFDAFAQADGSVTRKFGGTGLGLAICSELVRLMGGRIWVESEPGRGSTFRFTAALPVAGDDPVAQSIMLPEDVRFTRQLSILLAEDNPVNQKLASRFLSSKGHKVSVVASGQDAINRAFSEEFDVILMDNQMPGMGGVEATGRIRDNEKASQRKRTPIVALTASAMRGDKERFLNAGMDSYLAKPFRAEELYALVAELTNRSDAVLRP